MTFNSWEFLLFYPIVAILYFLLPKRMKWPMLLIASYFFYGCYQFSLLPLIVATTLVSWIASHIVYRSKSRALRRISLTVTLVVCFGVLFFYKYFDFLAGSVTGIIEYFGGTPEPIMLNLVLPVGISFYTFQTLSYVIDVYRGEVEPEKNPFFYALFVSFFPQLVAGPIERPGNLIPQLKESHKFTYDNFVKGGKHMLVGFFKKICVADMVSIYVNAIYNSPEDATALGIVIATMLFAVQIYCDFSGYTDIAIGCARIMGIRLMKNFDHPYIATSIKEFWSRWHISLSTWFKDYLYIPLGGNRCKKWRHLMNVFIVFLVSGLWHGAAWTFVIWGAIHGVYQIFGNLTWKTRNKLLSKIGLSERSLGVVAVRRLFTFLLVCFAWIFFRANSISDAGTLLSILFSPEGWSASFAEVIASLDLGFLSDDAFAAIVMTALSILTLVFIDRLLTYEDEGDGSLVLVRHGAFIYYVWIVFFMWAVLLSKDMTSTFIYFQF